jgi:hypothetical protein
MLRLGMATAGRREFKRYLTAHLLGAEFDHPRPKLRGETTGPPSSRHPSCFPFGGY